MLKCIHAMNRRTLDTRVPFEAFEMHLFQNNVQFDENTVIGDLVECDFDGYAFQAPAWNPAGQVGLEDAALAPALTWTAGAGLAAPQSCYGYYFLNDDGDLSLGETFEDGPIVMTTPGQELVLYPQVRDRNFTS